jgi:1-acyl-sn-glycerol-3-phosphate acyltransferase
MNPFKTGAAFVAKHTGAGIVPVAMILKENCESLKKYYGFVSELLFPTGSSATPA